MPQPRHTLMNPPIEDLLDKVDSKFTLVALSAKRARQINSYYNQLGEGLGHGGPAPGGLGVGQAPHHRLRGGGGGQGHLPPDRSRESWPRPRLLAAAWPRRPGAATT